MPIDLTEASTFASVVTVPQPGDLRKAASVVLFAQQLADRSRFIYDRGRTRVFDVTRKYGAVGNGIADDTSAIQDALDDAAASADGGDVFLPNLHRITAALHVDTGAGVRLLGIPNVSALIQDHATEDTLVLDGGGADEQPVQIYGLAFSAAQVNTGRQIHFSAAAVRRAIIENCRFSIHANCQGSAINTGSADELNIDLCRFTQRINTQATIRHHGAGFLRLSRSHFLTSASNATQQLSLNNAGLDAEIDRCFFDYTGHTSGTAYAIDGVAAKRLAVHHNQFKQGTSTAYAINIAAGLPLFERDNVGNLSLYGSTDVLLSDVSQLGIVRSENASSGGTAFTIGDDVHTTIIACSNTSPPVIALPRRLHRGRRIRVITRNTSVSPWASAPTFTGASGISGSAHPLISNGNTACWDLQVEDVYGSGTVWNIVGIRG